MKDRLSAIIMGSVKNVFPEIKEEEIAYTVEATSNPEHGDFATNIAMQLSKFLKKSPRDIASNIALEIERTSSDFVDKIDIAGPGFINFYINISAFQSWLSDLLVSDDPLKSTIGKGKSVMVEFVSANPTGPLHIGHGRGAAVGDSLARVYEAAGYNVHKEYYVNDAGNQAIMLAESIFSRYREIYGFDYPLPDDGYHGEYIKDIAMHIRDEYGESLSFMEHNRAIDICREVGIKLILEESIDKTLNNFNIHMDEYYSEISLYESKEVDRIVSELVSKGVTYEEDGALWLNTMDKGDEQNRVLRKSDNTFTYLTPDVAYHDLKFKRGFDIIVNIWGADHHGYIKRMESALEYLGHDVKSFDVVVVQMVGLLQNGEKIKMSTRANEFIPLDWLIDEIGVDAARFFYNMRSANSQFEFDIDLAKSKSSDNPVYYVQYGHARIMSLFTNAESKKIKFKLDKNLDKLTSKAEIRLIKQLTEFRGILELSVQYNEPHKVAYYLQSLVADFHSYYNSTPILDDGKELTNARLNLCYGIAKTIKFGLSLVGVSAPDRM